MNALNDETRMTNDEYQVCTPRMNTSGKWWLIWSNEHKAWWASDQRGYMHNVFNAGRYSFFEAVEICRGACRENDWTKNQASGHAPDEVMVPSPELIEQIEFPHPAKAEVPS